jgi:hypothetical protein
LPYTSFFNTLHSTRYKDEKHKAEQFPKDCHALATAQCIYAHQLKDLGVVDFILWEETDILATTDATETYKNFPQLKNRITSYIAYALKDLLMKSGDELVAQRYAKYRALGTFSLLNENERIRAISAAKALSAGSASKAVVRPVKDAIKVSLLLKHVAEETVLGGMSKYRKLAPVPLSIPLKISPSAAPSAVPVTTDMVVDENCRSAKAILDKFGVNYLCKEWLPRQSKQRVLITDTTMRDAHQSLLATRVRSIDIVEGAKIAAKLLGDAFSLECWGGATFGT